VFAGAYALLHDDARKTVEQVLFAEEQLYVRQAVRNHHLVIGHSTNRPPKLIAVITGIQIEGTHPLRLEHRSALTLTTLRGVIEGSLHAGFGSLKLEGVASSASPHSASPLPPAAESPILSNRFENVHGNG
jgi:hypothetical protein